MCINIPFSLLNSCFYIILYTPVLYVKLSFWYFFYRCCHDYYSGYIKLGHNFYIKVDKAFFFLDDDWLYVAFKNRKETTAIKNPVSILLKGYVLL